MDAEKFGAFVQQCRKELGLSQAQLAERLNVTAKAVSRWERGVGFPDIKLLQPLADALDISLIELMQSKRLEDSIPAESAALVVSETVESIRRQEVLSRRQKVDLVTGALLIGAGASYLYCLGLYYPFDPSSIGSILRLVALIGGVWGWRAFRSIVTESYLRKEKASVWRTWRPWAACGISLVGMLLCGFLKDSFPKGSAGYTFTVLGGMILLFPGAYYLWCYLIREGE